MDNLLKKCSKCKELKSIDDFTKAKRGLYKRKAYCKQCSKLYMDLWRENNKEKIVNYSKQYWNTFKKDITERKKEYKKQYDKENASRIREIKRKSLSKRMKENPSIKFQRRISTAVYQCLIGNKNRKHVFDILGYSLTDLQKHIEKQFTTGMTWENYGKWHVDHIIPKSAFNFISPDDIDFKKCWALNNLQPMWALDNIKKKDKIVKSFQPSLPMSI